jgi:hypothetical protein
MGWLDVYEWCHSADVGVPARAVRHFESGAAGEGLRDEHRLVLSLRASDRAACNCGGHASAAGTTSCLGVYFASALSPIDRSLENEGPLFVGVALAVRTLEPTNVTSDVETFHRRTTETVCDRSCVMLRAALGMGFGVLGVIGGIAVSKRLL